MKKAMITILHCCVRWADYPTVATFLWCICAKIDSWLV